MSVVKYNGIVLPYPLHSSFEMESGYDESTTDWQYTNLAITVQCMVNRNFLSVMDATIPANTDIVQAMRWIRAKLLQPRKTLSVKVGGSELVPPRQDKDAGGGRTVDAKNGPLPQRCVLNKLNDNTWLLTYSIKASYWENYGNANDAKNGINRAGNPIISCRWSETQEIDQRGYSRRIRDGLMVLRSDDVERKGIDNFREDFAVLGIPFGFVRKSARYTVDRSGLGLQFHLEDEEIYLFPPFPAYTARGYYVETTTRMGANRFGEVNVELEGSKQSDKSLLLQVAYAICIGKLMAATVNNAPQANQQQAGGGGNGSFLVDAALLLIPGGVNIIAARRIGGGGGGQAGGGGGGFGSNVILEQAIARSNLYENSVSVSMRVMLGPGKAVGRIEIPDTIPITSPPVGSEVGVGQAPQMFSYGNPDVDFILKTAAHFDPSLQQKLDQATGQLNQGQLPGVE